MTNKFNAGWQLTRLNAKKLKDVDDKINLVIDYYKNNFTKADLNRVMNWLRTAKMGYKRYPEIQQKFDKVIEEIDSNPEMLDNGLLVSDLSKEETEALLKDLNARKYNFQFKGRAPINHINFVEDLKKHLEFL